MNNNDAAREAARQPDGTFGHQSHAEADLSFEDVGDLNKDTVDAYFDRTQPTPTLSASLAMTS